MAGININPSFYNKILGGNPLPTQANTMIPKPMAMNRNMGAGVPMGFPGSMNSSAMNPMPTSSINSGLNIGPSKPMGMGMNRPMNMSSMNMPQMHGGQNGNTGISGGLFGSFNKLRQPQF